ncbi:MAG: FliH/SctL family protein [Moorellales bacterium]
MWSRVFKNGEALPDGRYLVAVRVPALPQGGVGRNPDEDRAQEMVREAEAQLARAREEAEALLRRAEARKAEIERTAFEQGYRKGYAQALEEARREAEALRSQARAVLEEARRRREEMIAAAEPEVVELALEVARQVVHRQLAVEPQTVVSVVREALRRLRGRRQLVICLNPEDVATVRAELARLQEEIGTDASLHLLVDPEISPGGCRVESEAGQVDATLEGQLYRLGEALRELARARVGGGEVPAGEANPGA